MINYIYIMNKLNLFIIAIVAAAVVVPYCLGSQKNALKSKHCIAQLPGQNFFQKGHIKKSIIAYKIAINLDPKRADAYYNLGSICLRLNEPNLAKKFLIKSIILNPRFKNAYNDLGAIYFYEENKQFAKSLFEQAINIDKNY